MNIDLDYTYDLEMARSKTDAPRPRRDERSPTRRTPRNRYDGRGEVVI